MTSQSYQLRLPDLGMGSAQIRVSVWLVNVGEEVIAGDRVLEVVSDDVVVDITATVSGKLLTKCVHDDQVVQPGSTLATLCIADDAAESRV